MHQGNIAGAWIQSGDQSFDYALLLGTFQELVAPDQIVREAFRVGLRVIIAYTNFAHYRVRLQILFRGRAPVTKSLPQAWFRTTNLHFLSTLDFREFSRQMGVAPVRQRRLQFQRPCPPFPQSLRRGSCHPAGTGQRLNGQARILASNFSISLDWP